MDLPIANDQESVASSKKTVKKISIIAISSIVLVGCIVAAVVGITYAKNNGNSSGSQSKSFSTAIKAVCDVTLYPQSCYNSLGPLAKSDNLKPQDIYKLSVQVAINELSKASDEFFNMPQVKNISDPMAVKTLGSCHELLSLALDSLNESLSIPSKSLFDGFSDLKTKLSAAGTYQQTCIDGFGDITYASDTASNKLKNSGQHTSNSLSIVDIMDQSIQDSADSIDRMGRIGRRRLMNFDGDFPSWMASKDRKLLQSSKGKSLIKVDVVVAKDGSGDFINISDALEAVPEKSNKRFVIYVKKGVYVENVIVEKKKWNVMMIGDGMDATTVSGSLNFVDGTPTFQTATFAVFGKGFIARDMGFRNTAGAAKHQAVALMSTADLSVFYRCKFDAYQDTLYSHSNRQFYRECSIYGTVDFIFGNSAVVFQNCHILPRKPMPGQMNTITAQGKIDPNQNTGISIQNCTIWPSANLTGVRTFLGRPWKNYSTTVITSTTMASFIDPTGWLPWVGTTAPDTIFYAEYKNFGPGAVTKNRVNWKGLKLNITSKEASKFSVQKFIQGDKWLPSTGVSFKKEI
ncbi:probable pectinesterase/pectinesterase inhibitor 46 [Nicotiana tomentosiformis]|uniref:probable pectinesterase/pectinesterase inhibitor 46 n=1 Tax=Nicotiana tomentosiformis TaxID=4098 RepID=UPI00051C4476|nr:probable pectinesterase/pectinesterase inhibitor 46 [Nicotiana tomentosiformis]